MTAPTTTTAMLRDVDKLLVARTAAGRDAGRDAKSRACGDVSAARGTASASGFAPRRTAAAPDRDKLSSNSAADADREGAKRASDAHQIFIIKTYSLLRIRDASLLIL